MILSIVLLIAGLAILIGGAESLVRGASSISKRAGIPPIVIGLTIVAFGTSAPEFVVNVFSAFQGTTDLALGNIIGSNIANILLILGISALVVDLKVQENTTWKEIPFAFLAMLTVFIMTNDKIINGGAENVLTRTDGLILLIFFAVFMYYIIELTRKGDNGAEQEEIKSYSVFVSIFLTIGGLLALFFGGKLLVGQAVALAQMAGLSEMLIGLTIVAVGTSLPEMATSIIAARRGQSDIAIGNVVGSNIFNVFWILGVTGLIKPISINVGANFDIFVSLTATAILFFAMFVGKKHKLERWQGGLFLLVYLTYMIYIVQRG